MIYVAADIHLRECTWKGRPDICGDQYNAWAQLCMTVAKDPEGVLVLAGDIFDTPYPTGVTEAAFSRGVEIMKGRDCYFIPGNHDDEACPRPWIFGMKELGHAPADIVEYNGFRIGGIPYKRSAKELHAILENLPSMDMLVLHTGFRHLLGFEETWQLSEEDIPDQVKMVFAGHVHVHSEKGKVYSPGSLALHRADEVTKGHGYFIVDPRTSAVTWKEVFTRRYMTVGLDKEVDHAALEELAANWRYPSMPVVLLDYRNDDTAKAEALQELYKDRLLFVCNARSSETVRAIEDTPGTSLDLDAVADDWLSKHLTKDQFELAKAFLDAEDPSSELSEFIKRNNL